MKPTPMAAELIERYFFAVRRELSKDTAPDVIRELRSLVEDRLQDQAQDGARPDVPEVSRLLQELGAPAEIARRYRPERFLVGPAHYPLFLQVVRWILLGGAGLVLLTVATSTAASPGGLDGLLTIGTWARAVGLYYQLVISLFASAVVVFAVLERMAPDAGIDATAWSPHDLPELPELEDEYFGMAQAVPKICGVGIFALVVNLLWARLGIPMFMGSQFRLVPLADLGLRAPLLWINLWLAAVLALRLLAFHRRRFTRVMRWLDIALTLAPAAILSSMATQPVHAPAQFPDLAPLTKVVPIALWGTSVALVVSVIVESIELLARPRQRAAEGDEPVPPAS